MRGRAVRLAWNTAFFGVNSAIIAFSPLDPPLLLRAAGAVVTVIYIGVWARYPFTGAWISGDHLIVRGWWRTRRWHRDEVTRVETKMYTDFLWIAGLRAMGGSWESGVLLLRRDTGRAPS